MPAMPPQGPAPQPGPPQGGPPAQGGEGGSATLSLIKMIPQTMAKLGQVMEAQGVPPETLNKLKQIIQMFGEFVDEASGAAGGKPEQGSVPVEAGGGKAVPAM